MCDISIISTALAVIPATAPLGIEGILLKNVSPLAWNTAVAKWVLIAATIVLVVVAAVINAKKKKKDTYEISTINMLLFGAVGLTSFVLYVLGIVATVKSLSQNC